jgi:hypothetical protein
MLLNLFPATTKASSSKDYKRESKEEVQQCADNKSDNRGIGNIGFPLVCDHHQISQPNRGKGTRQHERQ